MLEQCQIVLRATIRVAGIHRTETSQTFTKPKDLQRERVITLFFTFALVLFSCVVCVVVFFSPPQQSVSFKYVTLVA